MEYSKENLNYSLSYSRESVIYLLLLQPRRPLITFDVILHNDPRSISFQVVHKEETLVRGVP